MLKCLFVAAALLAIPTAAHASDESDVYFKCVEENTVALGKGNSEPAETVLRAANSKCNGKLSLAVIAYALADAKAGVYPRASADNEREARLRQRAGDRAIAALLAARAGDK